jgi:hypothetical protein
LRPYETAAEATSAAVFDALTLPGHFLEAPIGEQLSEPLH